MSGPVHGFIDFITRSPSAFHAVENACALLVENGFERLSEQKAWNLVPGGRYFVTRNRSTVIAFTVPQGEFSHFQIVASHSDSPVFKLKPISESAACDKYIRLNTERYGGMIMSSWFDRPLSIAGRVLVREGNAVTTRLVDLDRDAVMIPNVPIHFNRQINDGYKYNAQVDLLPLYGDITAKGRLMEDIASACGVSADAIVGSDLFLYCRTPGTIWGADDVFFSCPRIDNLECAYTSLLGFIAAKTEGHINVCAIFDNEEVGSRTKQGADSTFLDDVLMRASVSLGMDAMQVRAAIASSFMVSADNAHAVHPNHAEMYDAGNRTFMNEGIVIKHNADQAYTTDGVSDAIFSMICDRAGVPVQYFANRSDMAGGSTLGNIANSHVSMNTVDIGLAQLAMHSCFETAGVKDVEHMINALHMFYETNIVTTEDGVYAL